MTAAWWSQRFAAEGSAAAEGISKQLGRPSLDPLTILVREAAQNSWDARLGNCVDFTIELRRLGEQAVSWRSSLLPGPTEQAKIDLETHLQPDSYLLIVSDRNTKGLGGPLRADERAPEGVAANFVQFMRNVGEPSDHPGGGGTYGFGKGSFYALSQAHTIIVDSLCSDTIGPTRRLMGASLSHSYYDAINTRYTGRHWWGGIRNSIPDPLTGGDAQELSRLLSLPGFEDGRTGTDIAIVGADLGRMTEADDVVRERTPSEAATFIASSILWHLWPKFGSQDRTASMSFRVAIDGRDVSIPDPNQVTYIAPFVASLDKLSRGEGREYTRTSKPRRPGQMAHEVTVADPGTLGPSRPVALAAMPFQPPYRHIARMRAAELVVDYFPGPAQPDSMFGYAGVFRASADPLSEDIFAMSEPPTHDAWEERGLGGIALGVIRGSRKFIRDTMTETLMPATPVGGAVSGLGVLAAELAGLIPLSVGTGPGLGGGSTDAGSQGLKPGGLGGSSGSGASGSSGSGGTDQSGNGAKRRSHLPKSPQVKGAPRLSLEAEGLRIAARVIVPESDQQRRVTANAFVVLDGGGRETEPPLGADQPVVLAWRSEPGQAVSEGPTLALGPGECGEWTVLVSHVPDAVIRIAFTTQVG